MSETKHEKFTRIAEARTNKIIDMIRLLGNCSNTSNYEYSDADVKKIFNAIDTELRSCKNKYQDAKERDKKFTL